LIVNKAWERLLPGLLILYLKNGRDVSISIFCTLIIRRMHLFTTKILLYLSFNIIGYVFMFVSILGTPGMLDEEKPGAKLIVKLMGVLLPVAWKGIPVLLFASVAAFYFKYILVGKICSITSLSLGLALLLAQIGLYRTQSGKG
jgi:hypothetical protein